MWWPTITCQGLRAQLFLFFVANPNFSRSPTHDSNSAFMKLILPPQFCLFVLGEFTESDMIVRSALSASERVHKRLEDNNRPESRLSSEIGTSWAASPDLLLPTVIATFKHPHLVDLSGWKVLCLLDYTSCRSDPSEH